MIKKHRIIIILTLFLICLTAVVYFAAIKPLVESRIPVAETPETLEGESLGALNRYYMYSKLSREQISSIEVSNQSGNYKFIKKDGDFVLEENESVAIDSTALSNLVVTCSTTLSTEKVMDDAPDEKLSEYGLTKPEAYWVVTDNEGKQYKVYVGRELLTGGGYYCMFAGRRSVYVLDNSLATSVLAPVETYVTPYIIFGISQDDFYTVDDFSVYRNGEKFITAELVASDIQNNSEALAEHILTYPAAYSPDSSKLYGIFTQFSELKGESTYKLSADEEDFESCGLDEPEYMVSFNYKSREYYFLVSSLDDDGYYYVVSNIYSDIISKVPRDTLSFLEYDLLDWVSPYIFEMYITSVSEISVESEKTDVTFLLNHSADSSGAPTLTVETGDGRLFSGAEEVNNFRQLYKTYLSIDIQDYLPETVPESDVKMSDFLSDEKNRNLTFKVKTFGAGETTYEFYRYTTRRCAVKVNGSAEFYVPYDIVKKIESDTARFLNGEPIDSYGKN